MFKNDSGFLGTPAGTEKVLWILVVPKERINLRLIIEFG